MAVITPDPSPAGTIARLEHEQRNLHDLINRQTDETKRLRAVVDELVEALRLTVEYVGTETLPATPGWSWYDALSKHAPETGAKFAN